MGCLASGGENLCLESPPATGTHAVLAFRLYNSRERCLPWHIACSYLARRVSRISRAFYISFECNKLRAPSRRPLSFAMRLVSANIASKQEVIRRGPLLSRFSGSRPRVSRTRNYDKCGRFAAIHLSMFANSKRSLTRLLFDGRAEGKPRDRFLRDSRAIEEELVSETKCAGKKICDRKCAELAACSK